ncbi:hypothetical protein KXD40_007806 [Peronospora effusa]|uniref:RxLR effector protein n=1 Tax=Peronospora farinosa TaxID=134698 RepID=A0AAV0UIK6_9STRA|nr:hypothetical protein KXD40_007806 [Peronospora effusa]CAH0492723.1 unnamed protein product [Peronospora farinosa]CAI5735355.1 unnamed protein product [Peronospora farinosa]
MRLFSVAVVAAFALVSCLNAVAAENGKVVPASNEYDDRQSLRGVKEERSELEKNEDMNGDDRTVSFQLRFSQLYNHGVTPELLTKIFHGQQRFILGYAAYMTNMHRLKEKRDKET